MVRSVLRRGVQAAGRETPIGPCADRVSRESSPPGARRPQRVFRILPPSHSSRVLAPVSLVSALYMLLSNVGSSSRRASVNNPGGQFNLTLPEVRRATSGCRARRTLEAGRWRRAKMACGASLQGENVSLYAHSRSLRRADKVESAEAVLESAFV